MVYWSEVVFVRQVVVEIYFDCIVCMFQFMMCVNGFNGDIFEDGSCVVFIFKVIVDFEL